MTTITVNNQTVDLIPEKVAITISRIEIGDLTKRFINYTNSFKIPKTVNNSRIFGFPFEESNTSFPYKINSASLYIDGIPLILNGIMILRSNDVYFNVNIYEQDYDYFSSIEGLLIRDINPIADSSWEPPYIDTRRIATDDIVSPIVNWGKPGGIYQQNFYLPCFYYHSIIKKILEYTGLSLSGSILTDNRFTDLVIPFCGEFLYPETLTNGASGKATIGGISIPDLNAGDGDVKIPLIAAEYGDDNFDFTNNEFDSAGWLTYKIDVSVDLSGITWGDGTIITIKLHVSAGVVDSEVITTPTASGNVAITYTGSLLPTDYVFITISSNATIGDAVTIDPTSYIRMTSSRVVDRSSVKWNSLWIDVSCKDLVKDFFVRFGIIPFVYGGNLILKTIEEIISDRANALDWSDKLVEIDSISFDSGYSQHNKFKFKDSEFVLDETLGSGEILITNETLPLSKDIFISPFENTTTEITDGYNVATVPVYNQDSTDIEVFAETPKLKLLTLKDRTNEAAVTFYVTPRTDYKLAYFIDQDQPKDTGWQYFINEFYNSFSASLQKSKMITKKFNLRPVDIYNYNPHKIIWDGKGYYLVIKIINYMDGKVTSVDLMKL